MKQFRIVMADDHQLFIDGMKSVIEKQEQYTVVATANSGAETLELLKQNQADLVLLDIEMQTIDGIETAKTIRELYPETRILMITMYSHINQIKKLMRIGVNGIILKENGQSELLRAIETVFAGHNYHSTEVTNALVNHLNPNNRPTGLQRVSLTKREFEVLQCVAEGLTSPEIADKLFIAKTTINTHRKNIMEKLEVKNVAELIRYATEMGLLQ